MTELYFCAFAVCCNRNSLHALKCSRFFSCFPTFFSFMYTDFVLYFFAEQERNAITCNITDSPFFSINILI